VGLKADSALQVGMASMIFAMGQDAGSKTDTSPFRYYNTPSLVFFSYIILLYNVAASLCEHDIIS